jgi:hypothetical protein
MNPPTLVELRTAVAAVRQLQDTTTNDILSLDLTVAELNLMRRLNTALEQELTKAQDFGPKFLNWLKAINFIDPVQLPELSPSDWSRFTADPPSYIKRANAEQQAAILREIAKSQHPAATQEPKSC